MNLTFSDGYLRTVHILSFLTSFIIICDDGIARIHAIRKKLQYKVLLIVMGRLLRVTGNNEAFPASAK